MICRAVLEHGSNRENLLMWGLVSKNTVFGGFPKDLYRYIQKWLLKYPCRNIPAYRHINSRNFDDISDQYNQARDLIDQIPAKTMDRFEVIGNNCQESLPCSGHCIKVWFSDGDGRCLTGKSVVIGLILKRYPDVKLVGLWNRDHFDEYAKDVDLSVFDPITFCKQHVIRGEKRVCYECHSIICENHMHNYVCMKCGEDKTLCQWCHETNHSGHARWSDVPY